MKSRDQIRKQLADGVAVFLSQGNMITKHDAVKPKSKYKREPKEKIVEIEVDYLPKALQTKYFGE
jgi:hypothetical protein